jgi:hypothetical protein
MHEPFTVQDLCTRAASAEGGITLTVKDKNRLNVLRTQINRLTKANKDGGVTGWEDLKTRIVGPTQLWVGVPSMRTLGILDIVDGYSENEGN